MHATLISALPSSAAAASLQDLHSDKNAAPGTAAHNATMPAMPAMPVIHTVDSSALLQGHKAVTISHNGAAYRLQSTKLGKLILTK